MNLENFERLVYKALAQIPEDLRAYFDNVDIIVEDWPSRDMLAGHTVDEDELLLGLYDGQRLRFAGMVGGGFSDRDLGVVYEVMEGPATVVMR